MSTATIQTLQEKVLDGYVVNRQEALELYQNSALNDLGAIANVLKVRTKGDKIATYLIDRNINYTNVCVTYCKFCAFYREDGDKEGYVNEAEKIIHKITEAKEKGCTQILLQGGHHPSLTLDWYLNMITKVKKVHPDVTFHSFSPPELIHFSGLFKMPVIEILKLFKAAGMDSMPGGGAEILSDRVRKEIAPLKASTSEWLGVMRDVHSLGMRSTATMMFGHVETIEERIEHIFLIRELQEETGGFLGFIPWLYQPGNESLGLKSASGQEYLKTLALSRIILNHTLPNLQSSWVTPGKKIGQLGLMYGANDLGSIMLEENVVASTGLRYLMSVDEMRRLITEMGYEPHQRNTLYGLVN
ncbi:MAG TPA: cyclic dehypoxanthinyl futalosine synthase [bacterium]|jgi:cyclic dehypoxanthinyl futalosine synthase|nr:cyclic dehypoxanthinyl futalosine synthase [bacterium]